MTAMRTEKEQQVVEAAYGVFFRYGYTRTTMADLASAAKLSRPALYLVYPGKAEVFQAVIEWMSDNMLAAIRASLKDDWPLERKLLHVLELSIAKGYDEVRAHPDAADLLSLDHEVPAVEQTYARLDSRRYRYTASAYDYDDVLTVSSIGFVTTYPGLWEAVS